MKESGRYDTSGLIEAQFEPGSRGRVLKNLLGIKSKSAMDQAEAEELKRAVDALVRACDKSHWFTALDVCKIHKVWMGGIYQWAGKYRNVNLSKRDFTFAAASQIPILMDKFENGPLCKHTPCNFSSKDRIIQALAEVHVELILIHPFREGNGRVVRILSTLMASQAGLPLLEFDAIKGEKKKEYIEAIHAGLDSDYRPMEKVFTWVIQQTLPHHG